MFGDLYNEELVGRAVRELKAMRRSDIKPNGSTSDIFALEERGDVPAHLYPARQSQEVTRICLV